MKTTSLGIENLCVPCHSFCRYCLLSSSGKATGVDYHVGQKLAKRLYEEAKESCPDLHVYYYIGYCMDDPNLLDYIKFSQDTDGPSSRFMQLNGLQLRSESETEEYIDRLRRAGIESVDLTFYGTKQYHDQFAGRKGDFEFLIRILTAAHRCGLQVHISCPIHRENIDQIDDLLELLYSFQVENIYIFLPHGKGRGSSLDHLRLTSDDYSLLSDRAKLHIGKYKTEGEWLSQLRYEEPQTRTLTLSLTPENIAGIEAMTVQEILTYLEKLDDEYYAAIPNVVELAERYGDKNGKKLYRRFRDLHLEWQKKFLEEHGQNIWDMNDETHHFSIRV